MKNILLLIAIGTLLSAHTMNNELIEGTCKKGKFIPKHKEKKEIVYKQSNMDTPHHSDYCYSCYDSHPYDVHLVSATHSHGHHDHNYHHNIHHRIDDAFHRGHFESCSYCGTVEFRYQNDSHSHSHH